MTGPLVLQRKKKMSINSGFPWVRPRRVRADEATRRLVREHHLRADDLIYPVFVLDGEQRTESVASAFFTACSTLLMPA